MLLVDKILQSNNNGVDRDDLKELLKISKKTKRKQQILTEFFNKCTMSRILDLLLDNPDKPIFTADFLQRGDISQKSLQINLRKLILMDVVIEIEIGKKKFYKWNSNNVQAKHISKLRDILDDNVRLSE